MTLHLCWKQNIRRVAFLNNQRCFNVDVRRATAKYKHAQTAFEEAFNKEIEKKKLFKPVDAYENIDNLG